MSNTQERVSIFRKVGECLYRHSAGNYYALVKHGGKQYRKCLKTTDAKEAKRLLGDYRKRLEQTDPRQGKVTVGQLAEKYLTGIGGMERSTVENRAGIIRILKATWPGGEHVLAREVKPSTVNDWLSIHEKRLKSSTFNEYLRVVRCIFRVAVNDKIIAENPVLRTEKKREKPNRPCPSWDEFKAIVSAIRNNQPLGSGEASANLIEFMGLAGLGNAEAWKLVWGDVDFKRNTIKVYRAKTDTGFQIPIYPLLKPFLERLKSKAEEENNYSHEIKIFTVRNCNRSLASACKGLGLPSYSHRAFRRMFVTRALRAGVDIKTIAAFQGHSDGGRLILQTYSAEVDDEHKQKMAALLSRPEPPLMPTDGGNVIQGDFKAAGAQ